MCIRDRNQPLSAIASYAAGSLNLLEKPDVHTPGLMRQALERIAEQAERAGRVIKSVHDFVRRRDQVHEAIGADVLIEAVLPLVRLQARKSGARIEVDLPAPVPRVRCDRTMLEQVLLNLTRNGIQAMETGTAVAERVLTLRVRQTQARWVVFSVLDTGPGIPAEAAARLFTPLFTTKAEGMGLGLSLCRTVVEQHGGVLDFGPGPQGCGTEFRFTLPAPKGAETGDTVDSPTAIPVSYTHLVLGARVKAIHLEANRARVEGETLRSMAHTDALTGLPNRRGLQGRLAIALRGAAHDRMLAVFLMDLDGFKPVNDRFGHDVGDALLVAVGQRIQAQLRGQDVVARLGGDEFVVLAAGLADEVAAQTLAHKLLAAFGKPFEALGQRCEVGLTIGYAMAPLDGTTADELLKRADAAMYAGKGQGLSLIHI